MHFSTLINTLAFFTATGLAAYTLEDDYIQQGFFDQFSFATGVDTNHGFVAWQDQSSANTTRLIDQDENGVYVRVDSDNQTPNGRPSVKLVGKKTYQNGLIVADIIHMPAGCGTWPAFWTVGPNWPNGGEIDILEGVNDQTSNNVTLHTGSSCVIEDRGQFSGAMTHSDCGPNQENTGCQITADDNKSYGSGFNTAGGGVYAMQWTDSAINIFFFTHSNNTNPALQDAVGDSPDPSTWGKPLASFSGNFDMATAFVNQQIVINTNLCGDWAGGVWGDTSCHSEQYQTCQSYVESNPAAFKEAYWQFAALKVYKDDGNAAAPSSSVASAPVYSSTIAAASLSSSASAYSSTPAAAPSSSLAPSSSVSAPSPYSTAPSSSDSAAADSSIPAAAPTPYSSPSSSSSASPPAYSPSPSDVASPSTTDAPPTYAAPSVVVVTDTTVVYVTVQATPTAAQATTFATSASGYAPIVGGDGGVGRGASAAEATPPASPGSWSTGSDGDAVYEGRRARHLRVHRRREWGI